MSLNHILNTINEKTEEEIKRIKEEAVAEKKRILQNAETQSIQIKQKLENDLKQKTQEKNAKAKRQAQILFKKKVAEKKKSIINEILGKAVKKLTKQQDKLATLYESLPIPVSIQNGEIITTEESANLLASILKKQNLTFPIKNTLQEEGFMLISETVEIDNRLRTLIEEIRDKLEVEIARLIFN